VATASLIVAAERRWRPPRLEQLIRALDLWSLSDGRYLFRSADVWWPSVPSAQLVAAAIVAAERAMPGRAVRLASWTPGDPLAADRPVRLSAEPVAGAAGGGEVSVEVTLAQRGGPQRQHGRALLVLGADQGSATATAMPAARAAHAEATSGVLPAELTGPLGGWRTASEQEGSVQRALLAYAGQALTVPCGTSGYPDGAGALPATTLAYSIAFLAPLQAGLAFRRAGGAPMPREGYAHTLAAFVAPDGGQVAQVSQAVLIGRGHRFPQAFR
jgi:hypothetical protein